MDADKVFKALADPTRRKLLDLLYESNGQTLGQLCEHLDMARQSTTQHLGLLEAADLERWAHAQQLPQLLDTV